MSNGQLALALKEKARQLGFVLAGITTPQPSDHFDVYKDWIGAARHAGMAYLADERSMERRANPLLILPECKSILVLGIPYFNPEPRDMPVHAPEYTGRIAAYAWGNDYHLVLPERLQILVRFLEEQVGHSVPNRWYTDTGPVLERDLAVRAGLGWIGKNSCLISPMHGSYFLLAEIFLGLELEPDAAYTTDHCGRCQRCVDACPTHCILPNRTLDARRCISYLTIENKAEITDEFSTSLGNWIFGCDICQTVCPWNIRFAHSQGDQAFAPREGVINPLLDAEIRLSPQDFNRKFKNSPLKRAKRRGYLRNVANAMGNSAKKEFLPVLQPVVYDDEPLVREAVARAIDRLKQGLPDV